MTSTTTGSALRGCQRSREQQLATARERRLHLDPDRLAREQRIDETTVDIEDAWAARDQANAALAAAEHSAAQGIDRLLAPKVTVGELSELTGLDLPTIRRLRQVKLQVDDQTTES